MGVFWRAARGVAILGGMDSPSDEITHVDIYPMLCWICPSCEHENVEELMPPGSAVELSCAECGNTFTGLVRASAGA